MPIVTPQQIYQGLTATGMSPVNAAAFTAISSGREDPGGNTAAVNYTPSTGDYYSTGLFQFNLGTNFGPGGSGAANTQPGNTQDIWGSRLAGALGVPGNQVLNALTTNPQADYSAAAYGLQQSGFQPWDKNGSPLGNVPLSAEQAAVDASGGQVTLAQLQAIGNNGSGTTGNPVTGAGGANPNNPAAINNDPAAAALAGIQDLYLRRQIQLQFDLAKIDQQFAQTEAGYQGRLLGLEQQSLGIQQGALQRQMGEAPLTQADVEKMYQLQYAGIKQSGEDVNRQYRQQLTDLASSGAASGSLFTKGQRDAHANMMADWASATSNLQRQRATLQAQQNEEAIAYLEKLAAFQDQKKQYDIVSQRYGIQGEEIMSRLASSLQQTAIGAGQSVFDLEQQLANTDASMVQALGPFPITPNLAAGNPYASNPASDPYAGAAGPVSANPYAGETNVGGVGRY